MAKHRAPRLYIEGQLAAGEAVELETAQVHYLRTVLRLDHGGVVRGFNAVDGEWLCRIIGVDKGRGRLTVERQLRSPEPKPELIAWYPTGAPATALSKGLDRDRGVDETGGQIAVFGRLGSRPFTRPEMERLFLTTRRVPFKVTDDVDMSAWVPAAYRR